MVEGRWSNVHMKMILSMRLGVSNALLQNLLRLLDELSMQIDRIGVNASIGVVLAEDELGRLLVVFLHLATVLLALFRQLFGARTIAAGVCVLGLISGLVSTLSPMLRDWCGDHDKSNAMLNRGRLGAHTREKHSPRFEASCRARARNRSYSCSASPL